jgi:5-methylcytosine-specific restriction endonuclease McrA
MCQQLLPATSEYFANSKSSIDSLFHYCRACDSKRNKEYYLSHQEEKKKFRNDNRERLRKYQREHKVENNLRAKAWAKDNPVRHLAKSHKRRVLVQQNGGHFTSDDVKTQYEEQEGKCFYCDKKLDKYHIDHLIPISRGGSNDKENICIACPECNFRKGNKTPEEFETYIKSIRGL